jgi:hypothetical protein
MNSEYLSAGRKQIVQSVSIRHKRPSDGFYPKWYFIEHNIAEQDIWEVWVEIREGFKPPSLSQTICFSEAEAQEIAAQYPEGQEIQQSSAKSQAFKLWALNSLGKAAIFSVPAGDEESPLAFEVLGDSGLYEPTFGPISAKVLDFFGEEDTAEMKEKFGENWESAAVFAYSFINLPHSSPAFAAAAYQYHYYISGDDFSAGYYWRDLEVLESGAEAEATRAIEKSKKAGNKGGQASESARRKRRTALMEAVEDVAKSNPDVAKALGPKSLLAIALPKAAEKNPNLWSQGQGQAEEYLGEIRRGEAGDKLQERYLAIFPNKTA